MVDFLDEADLRKNFESDSIPSLVDYWSEVMPKAERAILLDVLSVRGFRTKSLPAAPTSDPVAFHEQHVPEVEEDVYDEKKINKRIRSGRFGILILAVFNIFFGFMVRDEIQKLGEGEISASLSMAPTLFWAAGAIYLILFSQSRENPRATFFAAIPLWASLIVFHIYVDIDLSLGHIYLGGVPILFGLPAANAVHREGCRQAGEALS